MDFQLQKILKTLLFSTSESLSVKDIQKVFTRYHEELDAQVTEDSTPEEPSEEPELEGSAESEIPNLVTAGQIREAMEAIEQELLERMEVYQLIQGPQGYRLTITAENSNWVRLLRDAPKPLKLSQPALETLAIVAYRQPATRAEIEAVRGVSVDNAINKLVDLELVHVIGRADLPGRPLQYATTEKFLEFTGICSLDELPASDVVEPEQLNRWIDEKVSGEPQEPAITDQDVGLPSDEPEPVQEASS